MELEEIINGIHPEKVSMNFMCDRGHLNEAMNDQQMQYIRNNLVEQGVTIFEYGNGLIRKIRNLSSLDLLSRSSVQYMHTEPLGSGQVDVVLQGMHHLASQKTDLLFVTRARIGERSVSFLVDEDNYVRDWLQTGYFTSDNPSNPCLLYFGGTNFCPEKDEVLRELSKNNNVFFFHDDFKFKPMFYDYTAMYKNKVDGVVTHSMGSFYLKSLFNYNNIKKVILAPTFYKVGDLHMFFDQKDKVIFFNQDDECDPQSARDKIVGDFLDLSIDGDHFGKINGVIDYHEVDNHFMENGSSNP
jgi:3',5'-cyclic AMP phosphodiesterase CpdA